MILRTSLLAAAAALALAGCATRQAAPVSDRTGAQARPTAPQAKVTPRTPGARAETYTVKQGDTLYSIALDNGLDYRELAAWNNIDNVSVIRVGQQLRLTAPAAAPAAAATPSGVSTAPLKMPEARVESRPLDARTPGSKVAVTPVPAPAAGAAQSTQKLKTGPKAVRMPYSDEAWAQATKVDVAPAVKPDTAADAKAEAKPDSKPEPRPDTAKGPDDLDWTWPTSGKVVSSFSETANLKGVGIAGKAGQPIYASAPGRVVYSGSGLRGYGKLIIIKHNATYLSVYAHNSELLVKEGQMVTRGQKIAEMGNSDSDQVNLHFEIRRLGKPVDPLKLLPDRG